uniref:Flagellin n=1 Tax=Macrostomum lignano TaxID=282301 RepID=A0A1I8FQ58_9PLAT
MPLLKSLTLATASTIEMANSQLRTSAHRLQRCADV